MSVLHMAWRNLSIRKIQSFITVIVVAIGVAMALCVLILSSGIREGIIRASEPYGMIVGAKGSANQLVFNTIFLMDTPLGNMPLSYTERLSEDERIKQAVPFALGDHYKGHRIVGTSPDFFGLRGKPGDPAYFKLAEGRVFGKPFEAVLGSKAAAATGLKPGDRFVSGHGVVPSLEEDDLHGLHPYSVVGIMERVNAPADNGIFVLLESYWISHGQMTETADIDHEDKYHAEVGQVDGGSHTNEADAEHADEENHAEDQPGVTALLVQPDSYMSLMQLYQEINNGPEAQAVFPGQVLGKVFDMMGSGERVLELISYLVIVVAALTVLLSLYSSTFERRRSIAIMRALGASRRSIFAVVIFESLLLVVIGAVLGSALAYALSLMLTAIIGDQTTLTVVLRFSWDYPQMIAVVAAAGLLAGVAPAIAAYRTEVAKHLNPV